MGYRRGSSARVSRAVRLTEDLDARLNGTRGSGLGIPLDLLACASVACAATSPSPYLPAVGSRQRLRAIVTNPKSRQKHVWQARIVLLSGAGLGTSVIMAETGKSKTCVRRWQERFMHDRVGGLFCDRSRPPKRPRFHRSISPKSFA